MLGLLWLVPALPFAGFTILALGGRWIGHRAATIIGVGSVGLSALLTLVIAGGFLATPPPNHAYTQTLWTWMQVGDLAPGIAFRLDPLSLVYIVVITFVGFLIHLYSTEYMEHDDGYRRFLSYLNLFVGSMLVLVLGDNLLLLYLGWEGVGLCSYLLIGFWYHDPANGYAARKAFVVTRIGDTAMAVGLFLLFANLHTFNIQDLMTRASQQWPVNSSLAIAAAALLLGGAVGKSAQLPLQTWLPDAMAGPTPVSALIHAATMVTAGVYLIARTHVLFQLAPPVMLAVAIIGALTLLIAGFSALTQTDLKRVLAYSTISQIGYMFLALGVGAWSAAIFHFFTHAFFKALLFLGAGVVLHVLNEEHDMFRMGGLRDDLPVTFWTFLIGSASLSALPLVTAGFYSKDLILWNAYASPVGSIWLYLAGLAGALLTSVYTFRMVFITFFGPQHTPVAHHPTWRMQIPLIVLAVFSIIAGFLELPPALGNVRIFSGFLGPILPEVTNLHAPASMELVLALIASLVSLAGIGLAYWFFLRPLTQPSEQQGSRPLPASQARGDNVRLRPGRAQGRRPQPGTASTTRRGWLVDSEVGRFWRSGWGFDWLYNHLFVYPYIWLANINKDDFVDSFYDGVAWLAAGLNRLLAATETGRVRWYALGFLLGVVILVGVVVAL